MKNTSVITARGALIALLILLAIFADKTSGIEGLKLSIQNETNLVLGWPSVTNATYIIQSTPALGVGNGWQTLTNFYPAFQNTNWTTYVITNAITYQLGGGGDGGGTNPPPPPPDDVVAGNPSALSETALASGDVIVPPTLWITESLPFGAILKPNGTYEALPSPDGLGGGATPNGNGSGGDPGFYLVVANGVTCVGVKNGIALSGTVTIPLEIAAPTNDFIVGAVLNVDGVMAPGGGGVIGPSNLWTFSWDTTAVANGTHQISAQVIFSGNSADMMITNSLTVSVSNLVTFPYYYSQVFGQGVGMWINAQSAVQNINWQVALYDSQTNYLGYFSGSSENGSISIGWDLQTNQNSPPLTDSSFRTDFYLFSAVTGKSLTGTNAAASKWMIGETSWTPNNMVIAYAPVDNNSGDLMNEQSMVEDGVVNICYGLIPGNLYPQGANQPNGTPWGLGVNGGKDVLLPCMPSCNFMYFFGHGSQYEFGDGTGNANNNITYTDLVHTLANFPGSRIPTNSHPYKLVFIDGCLTGGGPLCETFGIPSGEYSTNYFAYSGVRSRAYVGYTKAISYNLAQSGFRAQMLQSFWNSWFNFRSVHAIVTNCQQAFATQPMDKSAIIYGATNMFIGNY